jgi:hypothetical protein
MKVFRILFGLALLTPGFFAQAAGGTRAVTRTVETPQVVRTAPEVRPGAVERLQKEHPTEFQQVSDRLVEQDLRRFGDRDRFLQNVAELLEWLQEERQNACDAQKLSRKVREDYGSDPGASELIKEIYQSPPETIVRLCQGDQYAWEWTRKNCASNCSRPATQMTLATLQKPACDRDMLEHVTQRLENQTDKLEAWAATIIGPIRP